MTPLWILSLHLALLVAGLAGLSLLARAGAGERALQRTALAWALATGAFLFAASDPTRLLEDFSLAYHQAGTAVLHGPQALAPALERGIDGFVNLPIVAYLFVPFALLPGMRFAVVAFTLLGAACVWAAWRLLVRHAGLDALRAGQLLVLFAASGPLIYSFKEGNLSHLLLLPLVMGLVLLRQGRELAAGALLGLLAVLKPPLLLLGAYFVLRARWRVALGGLLAATATGLASLAVFGWAFHVRWYELCIAPYGRDPMPAFNVQSLQGFASRFEQGAAGLFRWEIEPLTSGGRELVHGLTAAIVLGVLAVALTPRGLRSPFARMQPAHAVRELELMMVLLLACVLSPLAWTHYYAWALVPAGFLLDPRRLAGRARVAAWVALGLLATPVVSVRLPPGPLAELHARSAASAVLLGALLMLAVLGWLRWCSVAEADGRLRPTLPEGLAGLPRGEAESQR